MTLLLKHLPLFSRFSTLLVTIECKKTCSVLSSPFVSTQSSVKRLQISASGNKTCMCTCFAHKSAMKVSKITLKLPGDFLIFAGREMMKLQPLKARALSFSRALFNNAAALSALAHFPFSFSAPRVLLFSSIVPAFVRREQLICSVPRPLAAEWENAKQVRRIRVYI